MANTYGKVSGTFEEIENAYGKVSGVWEEADEIYAKNSGTWELVFAAFTATSLTTLSSGSGTFTVPDGANAPSSSYQNKDYLNNKRTYL